VAADGLGFDVRTGYGLAETASIFTGNLPGSDRLGSEGKAFAGELRIAPAEAGARAATAKSSFAGRPCSAATAITTRPTARPSLKTAGSHRRYRASRCRRLPLCHRPDQGDADPGRRQEGAAEDLEKHYAGPFIKELAILERDGALVALVLPNLEAIRDAGYPRVDEVIRVALSESALALPSYERIAVTGWCASRCRDAARQVSALQASRDL